MMLHPGEMPIGFGQPHNETNESGHVYLHPGYEFRKCQKCDNPFICAKTCPFNVCGDPKLDRDGKMP